MATYLSDDEVFGSPEKSNSVYLSDDEVFGLEPSQPKAVESAGAESAWDREQRLSGIMSGTGDMAEPVNAEPAVDERGVPSMTPTSVARDIGAGLLQIGPTAVKGGADIARLATGDRVGKDLSEMMEQGMKSTREVVGSERAQVQRENFTRDMKDENVGIGEAIARNKGALADMALPTIGSMFLPVGVAGGAGKLATLGAGAKSLEAAALAARVAKIQQAAGVGTIAAQNAADTFTGLIEDGVSMEEAYLGAGISVPFTLLASKLTGGGADMALIRKLTGGKLAGKAGQAAVSRVATAGLREGGQEIGEETGQILGDAAGYDKLPTLNEAGKRVAVAGTLGALVGGGIDVATSGTGSAALPTAPSDPNERGLRVDVTYQNAAGETVTSTGVSPAQSEQQRLEAMRTTAATAQEIVKDIQTEAVADIGNQPTVDAAIVAAERAVNLNTSALMDGVLDQTGMTRADLEQAEAAAAAPSEAPVAQQAVELEQTIAQDVQGAEQAPTETVVWTGRRGDGYATEEAAANALRDRQRLRPAFNWQATQDPNGRWVLQGTRSTSTPAQGSQDVQVQSQSPTGGLWAQQPDGSVDPETAREIETLSVASGVSGGIRAVSRAEALRQLDAGAQTRAESGLPPSVNQEPPAQEALAAMEELSAELGKVFGWQPILVTGLPDAFGVQYRNRTYLDIGTIAGGDAANNPVQALFIQSIGHETTHLLEKSKDPKDKALYQKLRKIILENAKPGVAEKRAAQEGSNITYGQNEVVADVSGSFWLDKKFWARMFELDNGSTMRKVAYKFMENATKLLEAVKGSRLDVGRFLNEGSIDAVREVAAQVWAEKARDGSLFTGEISGRKQGRTDAQPQDNQAGGAVSFARTGQEPAGATGEAAGDQGAGRIKALPGAPKAGPDAQLVRIADEFARENGIDFRRQAEYVQVDPERAKRIAAAYEAMPHNPGDPRVKAAYAELIKQTTAQYRALEKNGYKFWFFDETNDPYNGNPWEAMRDLRNNKSMAVFATEAGFGSSDLDVSDNPLLADTGIEWPSGSLDGQLKRVLANDLFRAVHDAFGHGLEGAGFRAQGEENAWQAHVRLFTGDAVAAITTETRGQNSSLNYGPNGEHNQTAKVEDTIFADQKTGLLPEWVWSEGRAADMETGQVNFEVAPDPNNVELAARWGKLSTADKAEVSAKIATEITPKVLDASGATGTITEQIGSYEADTNTSFALKLTSGNLDQVSKNLGFVLSQDSMVSLSTSPFEGGEKVGAVVVDVGNLGYEEVKALYDGLSEAVPSVGGQSTSGGLMTILNYSDLTTPDLAAAVEGVIGARYKVYAHAVYSSFPEKKDYDYGSKQDDAGSAGSIGEDTRTRLVDLRAEATAAINKELPSFSSRSDGGSGAGSGTTAEKPKRPTYGVAQKGSMSLVGVHYSRQPRKFLDSIFYGTGMKGEEAKRIMGERDLQSRIFFYTDIGNGVGPEAGVGGHAHEVELRNIYNAKTDELRIIREAKGDSDSASNFERAIMAAGFDGYYIYTEGDIQGYVVLLGPKHKAVPVASATPRRFDPVAWVPRTAPREPEKQAARAVGDRLVRRPAGQEVMQIISARKAGIEMVAPSFKMQYGEASVLATEAELADQILAQHPGGFSFAQAAQPAPARESKLPVVLAREQSELAAAIKSGDSVSLSRVLSERLNQNDQTQTEAFKKWFGDSKVVDAEGNPLRVYHGTSGNEGGDAFTYFDTYASNYGLMGQGAYFTDNPDVANSYTTKGKGDTPTVYKAFLSIQNPIDMDAKADSAKWQEQFDGIEEYHDGGDTNESWYRAAEDLLRDQALPMWEGAEAIQDGLRAMGHDGITHIGGGRVKPDGVRHRVYIAFEPTQVKSATGNSGTFNPANPDIRFSKSATRKHGFVGRLLDKAPARTKLPGKALFTQATNNKNAATQVANLDVLAEKFPEPEKSADDWNRMMAWGLNDRDVPSAPHNFIKRIEDGSYADLIASLTPGQIADSDHGFESARRLRALYESGQADVRTTGKLALWSILSRGVSPYVQESLFLDSVQGIGPWIDRAAKGNFGPAVLEQYKVWADSVASKGSGRPGLGSKHNLNAFGQTFLTRMAEREPDGRTRMQTLHDLIADFDVSGQQIRREFLKFGEGVGVDNKVLSFMMMVSGRDDVIVLDRVQIRGMWDDGRFGDYNIYDGIWTVSEEGKVGSETGTALAPLFNGARGLAIYEALERALSRKVGDIYAQAGRPQDASNSRFHWDTWVAQSGQEASHGTIGGIIADASGAATPYADVTAKEGEYGAYAYGSMYGLDRVGMPFMLYPDSTGSLHRFNITDYREFLASIKDKKNLIAPKGFRVSKDEDGNNRTKPWFQDPAVNRQALDQLITRFGRRADADIPQDGGQPAADGTRPDGVSFSRQLPDGVTIVEVEDGFDAMLDGKRVGRLRDNLPRGAAEMLDESASVDIVKVDPEFKGTGIGSALYNAFNDKHGGRITPSGKTSPEAWALWKRKFPEKVQAFAAAEVARIRDGADPQMVIRNITDNEVSRAVAEAAYDMPQFSRAKFYSQLQRGIEAVPERLSTMVAPQWKLWIDSNAAKMGVKKDEIEWSGVKDYLTTRGKEKVSKQEISDYLSENGVRVEEILLGQEDGESKYESYTVPGGQNYREVLITLPELRPYTNAWRAAQEAFGNDDPRTVEAKALARTEARGSKQYKSSHFDQPNILAHLRVDDRIDADGDRVLFVQELQSDWGQDGKSRGFSDPNQAPRKPIATNQERAEMIGRMMDGAASKFMETGLTQEQANDAARGMSLDTMARLAGMEQEHQELKQRERQEVVARSNDTLKIPAAPFVTDTKAWVALALKNAIQMAAKGGYSKVAFITGEQAADLYSLDQYIDSIDYSVSGESNYRIAVKGKSGERVGDSIPPSLDEDGLEQYVGKEMAQKIIANATSKTQTFSGLDLRVGGEGMRAFYDEIVPQVARDVLKKLGGSLETVSINGHKKHDSQGQAFGDTSIDPARATVEKIDGAWRVVVGDSLHGTPFKTKREANEYIAANTTTTTPQTGFVITDAMREKVGEGLPLFSRAGRTPGRFDIKPDGHWKNFRRTWQDYFLRAQTVRDQVEKQGGVVNDQTDFYQAEALSHGRKADAAKEFGRTTVEPLMRRMAKEGVEFEELSLYAYAKHAPERNAQIASIDSSLPDGGSGMTNAEAAGIMQMVDLAGDTAKFESLHKELMGITKGTRDLMFSEGLITQDELTALNTYDNYIPLRGFEVLDEDGQKTGMPAGRGINVRGKETMRALGRTSRAGQLIENTIADRVRVIDRVERNQVGKVFLNFVLKNPDKALWEIDATRTRKSFNRSTGRVDRMTVIDSGPETVSVKVDGFEIYVKVKDDMLLRALRKAHKDDTGDNERFLMSTLGLYTTLLRNTLTRYNPEFALNNAVRDYGFGSTAILGELGEKGVAKFTGHYPGALAASSRYERGSLDPVQREWDKWFTEYKAAGGITAGFYQKGLDQIGSDIRNMMIEAGSPTRTWQEKARNNAVTNKLASALRVLEYAGSVSENAARVSAYRTAREMGKSPSQAALIAKNLTTNFDRKGELGQLTNALYVFYNAAVQSVHAMAKMLLKPKVWGYMTGVTGASIGAALAMAAMGGDDPDDDMAHWDKIPAYVKERNFIIMLPPGDQLEGSERVGTKGRYIAIPVQYGLNIFHFAGYQIADLIRNGQDETRGVGWAKAGLNVGSALAGSFNPFGGAIDIESPSSIMQAALPSSADVIVQFATGTDGFGREVAPFKSPFDAKPDSQNANVRQAGGPAEKTAQLLNRITGGSEYESGKIDLSPGTIQNIVSNATGGTGKFLYDSLALVGKGFDYVGGDSPDVYPRDMPVLRRVYGETGGDTDQGLFYERRKEIQEAAGVEKRMNEGGVDQSDPKKQALASMNKDASKLTRALAQIRRDMQEVQRNDDMGKIEKRARIRELKAERDTLTAEFNKEFMAVMREAFNEAKE